MIRPNLFRFRRPPLSRVLSRSVHALLRPRRSFMILTFVSVESLSNVATSLVVIHSMVAITAFTAPHHPKASRLA